MQKSPKRKRPASVVSIAVAAVLIVVLLMAGTLLRMHTREIGFVDAFSGFVSDTFSINSLK